MANQRVEGKPLSPMQQRVAEMTTDGLSGQQIAKVLGMSPRTVRQHITNASKRIPGIGTPMVKLARHIGAERARAEHAD